MMEIAQDDCVGKGWLIEDVFLLVGFLGFTVVDEKQKKKRKSLESICKPISFKFRFRPSSLGLDFLDR